MERLTDDQEDPRACSILPRSLNERQRNSGSYFERRCENGSPVYVYVEGRTQGLLVMPMEFYGEVQTGPTMYDI